MRSTSRVSVPPAHNSPSPNGMPAPPPACEVPCSNVTNEGDAPKTRKLTVSFASDAVPEPKITAPCHENELAHPRPGQPEFMHGHAAGLSPVQNVEKVPHGVPVMLRLNVP